MSKQGTGGNVKGKTDGAIASGKTFDVQDYPPTINFASDSYDNSRLVAEGSKARRPGGSMRTGQYHTRCNAPSVNEPIHGKDGNPGKSKFDS